MDSSYRKRLAAFALLAVLALGFVGCNATIGVGVGVPIYGGYGAYGPHPYGGIYVGGPIWP